jgi:hypothetical protein
LVHVRFLIAIWAILMGVLLGGYQLIAFVEGWPFSPGTLGVALAILVAGAIGAAFTRRR